MGMPLSYWQQRAPDTIADHVRKARQELIEAMKVADRHGEMGLHRRLGYEILALDDLAAIVGERSAE